VTAAATTAVFATGDGPGDTALATTALDEVNEKAEVVWAEIAALKERAEIASNYLGINSMADGYHQSAEAEERRAFWMRLSAIGCFVGAIAASIFALAYHVTHAFSLDGFLAKASIAIPFLVLATYLARESSHHSDRAHFNRQRQRQLESLPAYVDALDTEKRALLYETLAHGFFGSVAVGHGRDGSDETDRTGALLLLLVDELKKRADQSSS
jgi:hypothetical protein